MLGKVFQSWKEQGIIKWIIIITYAFLLYNINYFIVSFSKIGVILTPILYGFVLAYLMNPLIQKVSFLLSKLKIVKGRYGISIVLSYILVSIFLFGLILVIVPKVIQSIEFIIQSLPVVIPQWLEVINTQLSSLSENFGVDISIMGNLSDRFVLELSEKYNTEGLLKFLFTFTKDVSSVLVNLLLAFIISIYMVMSKDMYRGKIKKVIYAYLSDENANKFLSWVGSVHNTFGNFIVAKIIDSVIIGIMCYIGCVLLGFNNAILIGVIVGVTNVVPYFGPIIGAIPSAIIVLMQGWVEMLVFVVFIFALQQFDGNYLGPKLMGTKLGLNSLLIIIAVIIMSGILGIVGMFIGVPLFSIIYMSISDDVHKRLSQKGKPNKTEDYL